MRLSSLVALVLGALTCSGVRAQPRNDFATVRFRPAPGIESYLAIEGAATGTPGLRTYGLWLDYATETLRVSHPCRAIGSPFGCTDRERAFLEQVGLAHLTMAHSVGTRAQLSLALPLGVSDAQPLYYSVPSREIGLRDGFVLADLRLAGKLRLLDLAGGHLRVAASAFGTLPTGMLTSRGGCRTPDHCTFMGERGVQIGAQGIAEYVPHAALRLALNLGAQYRPARSFLGTSVHSELLYGLAAAARLAPRLWAKAEVAGALELTREGDVPLEARGALTYGRDVVLTAGAGAGLVGEVGSPRYRVFAGVAWTPMRHDEDGDGLDDDRDRCPQLAEDRDGHRDDDGCPDPDNDDDGRLDRFDRCPDAAEDRDGFTDDDGCPDPDNDGDGVLDGYDSCEGAIEDRDGDHDEDGCPDLDTDRDGVTDRDDSCVGQPEDTDGLADEDGCPEQDFDADGLDDIEDACPEAAETRNGRQDGDGCPD